MFLSYLFACVETNGAVPISYLYRHRSVRATSVHVSRSTLNGLVRSNGSTANAIGILCVVLLNVKDCLTWTKNLTERRIGIIRLGVHSNFIDRDRRVGCYVDKATRHGVRHRNVRGYLTDDGATQRCALVPFFVVSGNVHCGRLDYVLGRSLTVFIDNCGHTIAKRYRSGHFVRTVRKVDNGRT